MKVIFQFKDIPQEERERILEGIGGGRKIFPDSRDAELNRIYIIDSPTPLLIISCLIKSNMVTYAEEEPVRGLS